MVDPNHTVDRRRAHIRVGAAATATFLLFLLIGAFHGPASADPSAAPAAAPAATSTPTPESTPDPGQQQSPPFRGGRRWGGHRGYGAPPQGMPLPDDGSGQPSIPLPDDDSGQPTVPEPDNSGSGGQIS